MAKVCFVFLPSSYFQCSEVYSREDQSFGDVLHQGGRLRPLVEESKIEANKPPKKEKYLVKNSGEFSFFPSIQCDYD